MSFRTTALLSAIFLFSAVTCAKDKKKPVLPDYVLQAHTVAVVGDPTETVSIANPNDQRQALDSVEQAFTKWGRLDPTVSLQNADLVVLVRKGRRPGAVVAGDPNNRPVIFQPSDDGARIGIHTGPPVTGTSLPSSPGTRGSGMEVGSTEDLLEVYRGHQAHPLDSSPVWRYMGKDALDPPSVTAVEEFRKAIDASEKAKTEANKTKN